MKHVVHIFGASGSGTSTLGKKIACELGFAHMDTDDYFWMPTDPKFIQKRPAEERIALMKQDIEKNENVVISGALTGWGDVLIPAFTLVVRIEMDPEKRLERLRKREQERFGARIEAGGDMYEQHEEFIRWAARYDTAGIDQRSKARHDAWEKLIPCEILQLDGAEEIEEKFEKIKCAIKRQEKQG